MTLLSPEGLPTPSVDEYKSSLNELGRIAGTDRQDPMPRIFTQKELVDFMGYGGVALRTACLWNVNYSSESQLSCTIGPSVIQPDELLSDAEKMDPEQMPYVITEVLEDRGRLIFELHRDLSRIACQVALGPKHPHLPSNVRGDDILSAQVAVGLPVSLASHDDYGLVWSLQEKRWTVASNDSLTRPFHLNASVVEFARDFRDIAWAVLNFVGLEPLTI